jgi:hypothetical protein
VKEEEQPLPPSEEVEAVSSPSFSDWSSSDDDSERSLEDNKDVATEMPDDSPRLEWWEEAERKAEEEEDEMLEEQEALLESFATTQGRKDAGGRDAGHPRRDLSVWTWPRTGLPAVSRRKIR